MLQTVVLLCTLQNSVSLSQRSHTNLPSGEVNKYVVKVTVAKADDVANHRHDGCGACVALSDLPPLRRTGA